MLTLTRLRSAQRRRLVFHSMDSSVVKFVMKAVGQKCRGGSEIKRGQKYRELFFLGCHAYTLVCVLSVIDAMGIAKVIFFFSLSFKADKLLMLHSSLSWFITYLVSTFNPFPISFYHNEHIFRNQYKRREIFNLSFWHHPYYTAIVSFL